MIALMPILLAAPVTAQEAEPCPRGCGFWSNIVHAVGGALVGGWIGWVGSQVAVSDWEKNSNDDLLDQRAGWVGGGVVLGVMVSQLVGRTSSPGMQPELQPFRDRNRNVLTREEIERAGVTNVYDLIASERREWLVTRGANRWVESARGQADEQGVVVVPGAPRIKVYLDANRLGGVETLRDLAAEDLDRIEFIGPQRAATLYGTGHAHGVIQLHSKTGGL
ncbi:MAG: TonB-dependent receptor plug domain-containing protein [Gemmatimonadota bacterium]